MSDAFLHFWGPALAGVTETSRHLGWADQCRWQVPQVLRGQPEPPWGHLGPCRVQWRHRNLLADVGYRGSLWTPPLANQEWWDNKGGAWVRFRQVREASMKAVQGVVFVADSQAARSEANVASLERLATDLAYVGRSTRDIPVVFALNKRDLHDRPRDGSPSELLGVDELRALLTWPLCDYVETSALTGSGVEQVIERLFELIEGDHR